MKSNSFFYNNKNRIVYCKSTISPNETKNRINNFQKTGYVNSRELFKMCDELIESGMSRKEAETVLSHTERILSGPVNNVLQNVKSVNKKIDILICLNVFILLLYKV